MSNINQKLLTSVSLTEKISSRYKGMLHLDNPDLVVLASADIFLLQEERYQILVDIIEELLI